MASGRETNGGSAGNFFPGDGGRTERLDSALKRDPALRELLEGDLTAEEVEEEMQFDDESLTPDQRARRDAAVREALRRTQQPDAELDE